MEFRRPRAHAVWTGRRPTESEAPEARIIHVYHAGFGSPASARVGIRPARAYRKCGSRDEIDWIRAVRVLAWDGAMWQVMHEADDLPRADEITWLDADLRACSGVLVEVRRSWIDDWWPSWNLVSRGVIVEGDGPDPELHTSPATPMPHQIDLGGMPTGVEAFVSGGEIRYRTRVLEIGYRLGRPALSFLAFDPDGLPAHPQDLLRHATLYEGDGNDWIPNHALFGQFALGPRLVTPDGMSHIGQFAAVGGGTTTVEANTVTYDLDIPSIGHELRLAWTVEERGLRLDVARRGGRAIRAVESSVWHLAFDCRVSPPSLVGRPERTGETGRTLAPATLHVPGRGSLALTSTGDVALRFEAARPLMTTGIDIKLGEEPSEHGDSTTPPGSASGSISFEVTHGPIPALVPDAPPAVQDGIRRAWLTGMTYRLDTTSLSNNANSIHVPASLETWAPLAAALGPIDAGTHALDLVRDTIDRTLDGAPGYGAGRTSSHPGLVEDEYVHTDASLLLGIAHLVAAAPDPRWLATHAGRIREVIERTHARDVDDDGLIECTLRTGVTGSGDWSSNLDDIVSFGWKDAYSNAVLFDALTRLPGVLVGAEWDDLREDMRGWANRLTASFVPAFWNDATGRLGGWRSPDGVLHDAGFLWVNGVAVNAGLLPPEQARTAISGLWREIRSLGFDDFRLGLPLNARPIRRGDMVERFEGMPWGYVMPHGFNMNGAASLTALRHFATALATVGMDAEADQVLEGAMSALADGSAIGGCTSGVDLRTWDGTPCGYEGILTDQFGIVLVALQRYGRSALPGAG